MMDRFRLVYLKSTGSEKSFDESFRSEEAPIMARKPSPSSGAPPTLKTFSSEAILKYAKSDLKHPDPKIRISAIKYYLEKSYPSIPLSLLHEILSDPDPEVRVQALYSLMKYRNPTVSSLVKKHLKDSDPKVRIVALRGMFQFGEKVDLNVLIQFLSDESPWVRRKMATLLGWNQREGALPILMELSKDQDVMVKKAALFSLMTLYPEEGEERLMEAMTDSDSDLRIWVRGTLDKIIATPLKGGRLLSEIRLKAKNR